MPIRSWPQITSTRDNCLGARCADFGKCHVVEARRKAVEADIVIVNHHLLLADLALKEDGFGDLLGAADAVILDEAHQIPDLATQFFGTRLGSRQVEMLLRDARQELGIGSRTGHHVVQSRSAPSKKRWRRWRKYFASRRGRTGWRPTRRWPTPREIFRARFAILRQRSTITAASPASRSARRVPPSSPCGSIR